MEAGNSKQKTPTVCRRLIWLCFFVFDYAVFLFCCHAAADMPFLFVFLEHLLDLTEKLGVFLGKACGYILMNGAFTDSEYFGGASDGGAVLDYVLSEAYASFLFRPEILAFIHCIRSSALNSVHKFIC